MNQTMEDSDHVPFVKSSEINSSFRCFLATGKKSKTSNNQWATHPWSGLEKRSDTTPPVRLKNNTDLQNGPKRHGRCEHLPGPLFHGTGRIYPIMYMPPKIPLLYRFIHPSIGGSNRWFLGSKEKQNPQTHKVVNLPRNLRLAVLKVMITKHPWKWKNFWNTPLKKMELWCVFLSRKWCVRVCPPIASPFLGCWCVPWRMDDVHGMWCLGVCSVAGRGGFPVELGEEVRING